MIEIDVDVSDLAQVRFTTDAVWEVGASIHAVMQPRFHILHKQLRPRIPRRPDFDLDHVLTLGSNCSWIPDVLAPPPSPRPAHPLVQIEAVRRTDLAVAESDLLALRQSAPDSATVRMTPQAYLDATADALAGWWSSVLEPLWERVDAICRADIAHHQAVLAADGFAATLPVLHRDLSFDGRNIRIDLTRTNVATRAAGAGVWFVPSVFRWPWIAADVREGSPVVSYAARGSGRVWQEPARGNQQGLPDLIGRTRATILERLDVPLSTTALSRALGLSLSTVSEHLSVMTSSGLLQSRREGQRVLYWRTTVGDLLVSGGLVEDRRSG